MKKLLLTSLLAFGLLLPASVSATENTTTSTEFFSKRTKKNKSRKAKRTKSRSSRSYSKSGGCTYNGHQLYVGSRGGCYYYAGNSKEYVDRAYCSGCK
ncbi:hypothetical protein [Chryseobacterium oryctis]|uniref:Uncharacterized protein n=1 Tax=Chryseobacterium oryctis TaxID=2952618 RepID=A0ABT3HLV5_9FLAO|nr:hypothetical protein [Chryseobacterium oryctis]MCW3160773.1 hypothetical protein [Chryseobacterium oryctis]